MPQADPMMQMEPNEIFVFGSNTAGIHGAGAALQARLQWQARWGVGEGLTGQCYAFPTLDGRLKQLPIADMQLSRDLLYGTCSQLPDLVFLLTRVGCGLAGYPESVMRELFENPPANLILPSEWQPA